MIKLTHWGRVTHICVSKLAIIGSDNGLSPGRRQAITWTTAGMLLLQTLGTNFSEIFSEICAFSFKKMHLKMSSAKWRPFCLGLNVLRRHICNCTGVFGLKGHVVIKLPRGMIFVMVACYFLLYPFTPSNSWNVFIWSFSLCACLAWACCGSIRLSFWRHRSTYSPKRGASTWSWWYRFSRGIILLHNCMVWLLRPKRPW